MNPCQDTKLIWVSALSWDRKGHVHSLKKKTHLTRHEMLAGRPHGYALCKGQYLDQP